MYSQTFCKPLLQKLVAVEQPACAETDKQVKSRQTNNY